MVMTLNGGVCSVGKSIKVSDPYTFFILGVFIDTDSDSLSVELSKNHALCEMSYITGLHSSRPCQYHLRAMLLRVYVG